MDHVGTCSHCGNIKIGTPRDKYLTIIRTVADRYNTTVQQIVGRSRSFKLVEPRREAMAILQRAGLSCAHIGRIMDRDHTTVMHNIRRYYQAHAARLATCENAEQISQQPTAAPPIFPYKHRTMAEIMRLEAGVK